MWGWASLSIEVVWSLTLLKFLSYWMYKCVWTSSPFELTFGIIQTDLTWYQNRVKYCNVGTGLRLMLAVRRIPHYSDFMIVECITGLSLTIWASIWDEIQIHLTHLSLKTNSLFQLIPQWRLISQYNCLFGALSHLAPLHLFTPGTYETCPHQTVYDHHLH